MRAMADELATLCARAASNPYEIAALVAVLERKNILPQEVVDGIARLKQNTGKAR